MVIEYEEASSFLLGIVLFCVSKAMTKCVQKCCVSRIAKAKDPSSQQPTEDQSYEFKISLQASLFILLF